MEFPQQFGKYTLLKKLATGGMAEIFLARQAGMGGFEKDVVVKRLLPEHGTNQELVSMFLDEARIAANLTHPAIAQIFDLGTQGDSYYIAMEFVHGVDLRRLCSQGIAEGNFLPLNHAIRVIAEVCDALAYAHARTDSEGQPLRIVHRDISPTNILVTFEGGVKLCDFGIAKAANKATVTRAGQIKGKFGYMSPEQVQGLDIDARSDLFAVGINLYEITLGRRLFRGETDLDTMRSIEECVIPSPREIDPNYPEALDRIVMKALSREPERRFQTARDMQIALEDFLAHAGLRSTAGMLAEYMRHLFREQLELEAQEAPALRALARSVGTGDASDAPAQALPPTSTLPPVPRPQVGRALDPDSVIRDRDAMVMRLPVGAMGDRPRDRTPPPEAAATPVVPAATPAPAAPPSIPAAAAGAAAAGPGAAPPATPPGVEPTWRPSPQALDPLGAETPVAFLDANAQAPAPKTTAFTPPDDLDEQIRRPRRYFALVVLAAVAVTVIAVVYLGTQNAPIGTDIARALPSKGQKEAPLPATEPPPPRFVPKGAVLRLTSQPPGARVVVNGNVLEGVTPTTVQTFAGVKSTVRMLLPKHLPAEQRVDVPEAGLDVNVALTPGAPPTAALRVETSPVGAQVAVNGTEIGPTPLALPKVAAGTALTLRITHPGHYPHVVDFLLTPGEEREVGVQLIPDTGPRDTAVVNVETIPGGASVSIVGADGQVESLGKTGRYPMKIKDRPLGEPVRLRADAPGHLRAERDLDLREPFYTVYVRLPEAEKFYGALSVLGAPGLTVYVGPREVGTTPLKAHKLAEGEHEVVIFDAKSRARQSVKVLVERDKTLERTVTLGEAGIQVQ